MNEEKELNESQKKFCEEWVYDFNATRAYQEAYPDATYDSAKANGSRLIANDNIKAYIKHLKENVAEQAGISKLMVLGKLTAIIEQDISEALGVKDKIKALEVVNKMLGFNDIEKKALTIEDKRETKTIEELDAELLKLKTDFPEFNDD